MQMQRSLQFKRGLLLLAILAGFVLVPTAAQADPSFYDSPIFGAQTTPDGTLLVADYPNGIVNGDTGALVASLPEVQDIAPRGDGKLWAVTAGADPEVSSNQSLYSVDGGVATLVADLFAFEADKNPHPFAVDSNPFKVVDAGGGEAYVTDAGGNDLIHVKRFGNVKLIAVLPDEVVSTANIKKLAGCPAGPPDFCDLPSEIPTQAVPTGLAIGPDGWFYVGELKGFPAPTGESKVWRIRPNASNVRCGKTPRCQVALDGFTSVIDLAFGPDGRLYVAQFDDASWAAIDIFQGNGALGGSVSACNVATGACEKVVSGVPMLTAITFRKDGSLWGTTSSLVPGAADVIKLLP
jgi:hypothetical protein